MNVQLIFLAGHATKDSELIESKAGKKFAKFTLAVNDYKSKAKEKEEKVTYYDVLVFGTYAEKVIERVKKGDAVVVNGRPEFEAYMSKKDNEPKVSVTIMADSWQALK